MQGLANFLAGALREASDFTESERVAQRKREDDEIGRRRGVLDELKRGVEEGRVHPSYYAQIIKDIDTLGQGLSSPRRAKKGGAGFFGASETPVSAIYSMIGSGEIPITEEQRGPLDTSLRPPAPFGPDGMQHGYLPKDERKPAFLIDPMDQLRRRLEITSSVKNQSDQERYDWMFGQLTGSGMDPDIASIYATGKTPQAQSRATGSVFQRVVKSTGAPVTARIDPNSQQVVFVGDATIDGHHYAHGEPIPPGLTDPLPFRQQQTQIGNNLGTFNPFAPPGQNPFTPTNTPGPSRTSTITYANDEQGNVIGYFVPPTVGGAPPSPVPLLVNGQSIFRTPAGSAGSSNNAARAAAQAILALATKSVDDQILSITFSPEQRTTAIDAEIERMTGNTAKAADVRAILGASVSGGAVRVPVPPKVNVVPQSPPQPSGGSGNAMPRVGDPVGNPPTADPLEAYVLSDPTWKFNYEQWLKDMKGRMTEQELIELGPKLNVRAYIALLAPNVKEALRKSAGGGR